MARSILRLGTAAWLLAGAAGLGIAAIGPGWLIGVLPPLAIGADALARAVGAISTAVLMVGVVHVAVLAGLRTASWGHSAAILLAAFLATALLTLAAAAIVSAVTQPEAAPALIGSGVAALLVAACYGIAGARLVGEVRARPGI